MSKFKRLLYLLSITIPVILGYLVWDVKGDIYELSGNMRLAQYVDRENDLVFAQDILLVENHIENKYLDKYFSDTSAVLVFGQRNPDLPKYSIFLKILGENPENMKNYYNQIVQDFIALGRPIIDSVRVNRENELENLNRYISTMESVRSSPPKDLREGESFMNISKQLSDLKERKEFLEISLDKNSLFNYYSLSEPKLIKKRDKSIFLLSLLLGVAFLISFFSYLVWRTF